MAYVPINFGVSNLSNDSGNTGLVSNQIVFAGGNNITLSQATNAQGSATVTILAPNAIAQSNQTLSYAMTGSTGGNTSAVTVDARSLTMQGLGNASVGISTSAGGTSLIVSASQSNQAFSASGGSSAFQTLNFANSNGLTLSNNAGSVVGSYTVPTVTNSSWTVSDNVTSATVGRLAFTQSNGLTMSLSTSNNGNHTVIGSYTVPTVTNSSMSVSDANTSGTLARLAFTNLNGVTLSLSSGAGGSHTIVGSHNALTSQSNQTLGLYGSSQTTGSASSGTYNATNLSIIGAGIVSVGNHSTSVGGTTTGLVISATQSNQAFSASGGSSAFQTLNFANSNGLTLSNNGGSVVGSYTVPTVTNSSMSVSDAATSGTLARLAFTNLNNVTLSLSTGAGGSHTVVGSVNAGGGGAGLSAGTQSVSTGTVNFANSNGISFGMSGSNQITASYTVPTQTNQTLSYAITGNTTVSSALTVDARSLTLQGLGAASVGVSTSAGGSSIIFSSPNQALSGSNGSYSFQTATFGNLNGMSFYTSNGSMVGSYTVPTVTNSSMSVSDAATSGTLARLAFTNLNNVTLSLSTGAGGSHTVVGSVNAGGGGAGLSAGTQSVSTGTVNFANSNGISFGMSGSNQITASYTVPTQTNQTLSYGLSSNTVGNTSAMTFDARSLSIQGMGGASVGLSTAGGGSSLIVSAPTTGFTGTHTFGIGNSGNTAGTSGTINGPGLAMYIVGTNDITLSQSLNGSSATVTIVSPPAMSDYMRPEGVTAAGTRQANSSVSLVPFYLQSPLAMSNIRIAASVSAASAANNSSASQAYSLSVVLYTRNASTLSSIWSGYSADNTFWTSNNTTMLAGARGLNVTGLATTLNPDHYWAAVHLSTTNTGTGGATTALGASYSMAVGVSGATAMMGADPWNAGASAQSRGLSHGLGLYSTNATRGTIGFNDAAFSQTGNTVTMANLMLHFRNWTIY